jgi:glycyl-tRNA synthetase beta chain
MIQSAVALNSDAVKTLLRGRRTREDVLDAVLALHEAGYAAHSMGEAAATADLANVFRWADSLGRFVAGGDGLVLLAVFRRAHELVCAAEAAGVRCNEKPQPRLYRRKEERELAVAIALGRSEAVSALAGGDFDLAMRAVGVLRPFAQSFFDKVSFESVMLDLRENRLRLLNELRMTLLLVGDLSKIAHQAEVV